MGSRHRVVSVRERRRRTGLAPLQPGRVSRVRALRKHVSPAGLRGPRWAHHRFGSAGGEAGRPRLI